MSENPSPSEFRAELARRQMPRYVAAVSVGIHPARLGRMLNERVPMPAKVAERLAQALQLEDRRSA